MYLSLGGVPISCLLHVQEWEVRSMINILAPMDGSRKIVKYQLNLGPPPQLEIFTLNLAHFPLRSSE